MKFSFKTKTSLGLLILAIGGGLAVFFLIPSLEGISKPFSSPALPTGSKASEPFRPEQTPKNKNSEAREALTTLHEASADEFNRLKQVLAGIDKVLPADRVQEQLWAKRKPEYDSLLKSWGLDSEMIRKVEDIIQSRNQKNSKLRNQFIQAQPSSTQSREIKDSMNELKAQTDHHLGDLLGNDRFQNLQRWENTRDERAHLEKISQIMELRAPPLSSQQEQAVVDAMYDAKILLAKGRTTRIERLGPTYTFEVTRRVADVLSGDQRTVLQTYLADIMRR